jgi:hypothetical protein
MPEQVFTIYKVCRMCEGAKQVELEFTDGRKQLVLCTSCQGKGNFVWGYMVEDGRANEYIAK